MVPLESLKTPPKFIEPIFPLKALLKLSFIKLRGGQVQEEREVEKGLGLERFLLRMMGEGYKPA